MDIAPEYVRARRALLDVLDVLAPHRAALILVGAQAVYLHAPTGLSTPAYTTDADLAISPDLLATEPEIAALLTAKGYRPTSSPGGWTAPGEVHIDLMVPDGAITAHTRRRAPLHGHDSTTARRAAGLELALVDSSPHGVPSFDASDTRHIVVNVANPAALVIARGVKLRERLEANGKSRVIAKDAGDLLRLLRLCDAPAIGERLDVLARTTPYSELIHSTISWLIGEVEGRNSQVVRLAVAAAAGSEPDAQVSGSLRTLVRQLR